MKARAEAARAFICFSVFGTPDETLALVVDILRKGAVMAYAFSYNLQRKRTLRRTVGRQVSC